MICAGAFPAAVRKVLRGGVAFGEGPVVLEPNAQNGLVQTLTDDELNFVKQVGVTQVYFRECDVDRAKKYKKIKGNSPYHRGNGDDLSANGFPKQCGNALGDYAYGASLKKSTNFIAEVFAKQEQVMDKPWFRAGIVHLVCKKRTVELNVICTDAIKLVRANDARVSLFRLVIDFALDFARGQAHAQSTTQEDDVLVKYSLPHAYGSVAAQQPWESVGAYVTLEATTLGSMTKYMHKGFRFAPLVKATLLNDTTTVGCFVNDIPVESEEEVNTYLENCLKTQIANPDSARFTDALWGAMQALAKFATDPTAKSDIEAVQTAIGRGRDEFDPAFVTGTERQRFTYATLALLTALALLYANPGHMLKEDAEEAPTVTKSKGANLARSMRALFNDVSAQSAGNNIPNAGLVNRMLEMANRVDAIQMVKHNS